MHIYKDVFVYNSKYEKLSNEEIIQKFNKTWDKRIKFILMFEKEKDATLKLLLNKRYDEYIKLLTDIGIISHFSEQLLKEMGNVYVDSKSLSEHFEDSTTRGRCYSMSTGLSLLFDDCVLNKGIVNFPLISVEHQWLEHDDKVYDTTLHLVFPKDYYYNIYTPKDVKKLTEEEIEKIKRNPLNRIEKRDKEKNK